LITEKTAASTSSGGDTSGGKPRSFARDRPATCVRNGAAHSGRMTASMYAGYPEEWHGFSEVWREAAALN
jgi:hypothetical protein